MKKVFLWTSGIGLAGFGIYTYIKYQLDLALQYEYDIKDLRILTLTDKEMSLEAVIRLVNKSEFQIEVLEYDLTIMYRDIPLARSVSTSSFEIRPNASSMVKIYGETNFSDGKKAILPLATTILKQQPLKIGISGYVKAKFMGITHTIRFEEKDIEYSSNLLKDYNLDEKWNNIKSNIPFLKKM